MKSQTQRAAYCMIPFISHSGKDKTIKTVVARDWGWGGTDYKGAGENFLG